MTPRCNAVLDDPIGRPAYCLLERGHHTDGEWHVGGASAVRWSDGARGSSYRQDEMDETPEPETTDPAENTEPEAPVDPRTAYDVIAVELPAELPVGSVVLDRDGLAWQSSKALLSAPVWRRPQRSQDEGLQPWSWAMLVVQRGPLRVLHQAATDPKGKTFAPEDQPGKTFGRTSADGHYVITARNTA